MGEWATWTKKVSPYGREQLCVIIDRSVIRGAGIEKGDMVRGAVRGPSDRWVPFTKKVQVSGSSRCIYLDRTLLEATACPCHQAPRRPGRKTFFAGISGRDPPGTHSTRPASPPPSSAPPATSRSPTPPSARTPNVASLSPASRVRARRS